MVADTGSGIRVLLVEDLLFDSRFIQAMLDQGCGTYQVILAETLAQAETCLNEDTFDLIITDLTLPDSGGVATVEKLIPLARQQGIPIIVLSGTGTEEVALNALQLGVQDYLIKDTVDARILERAIRYAMERYKAEQQTKHYAEALKHQQQLNALQADFISMASHELRTPLTIIDGARQLLSRDRKVQEHPNWQKQLRKIESAVFRMSGLIEATLNLSKIENGKLAMEYGSVDISLLLKGLVERYSDFHSECALQFEGPASAILEADAKLLDHVVSNLIENAIKYSNHTPRIVITLKESDTALEIHVNDNGIGIAASELPRIFEKFYRVQDTSKVHGSGMGLYITRHLIGMHGGDIRVESAVGAGSAFIITLPRNIGEETEERVAAHG